MCYSKIRKYVHISMNNNPHTLVLARFPNLANVQVIVDFTIKHAPTDAQTHGTAAIHEEI